MLPFLYELKSETFDCLSFMPGVEEGDINLETGNYIEKGEEVTGIMGNVYHINIFKETRDGYYFDSFEAVLADPLEYISHIIPSGFFGFINKKTSTSNEFNQEIVSGMQKSLEKIV